MSMKQAAEELLKIADELEAQADKVTNFVCDKCNHTATLASINAKRKEAAEGTKENYTVNKVSVNDRVSCPACDGIMSYVANEDSKAFYVDEKEAAAEAPAATPTPAEITEEKKETPAEQAAEEQGKKLHAEPHKEASEPIDYDSLKRYRS